MGERGVWGERAGIGEEAGRLREVFLEGPEWLRDHIARIGKVDALFEAEVRIEAAALEPDAPVVGCRKAKHLGEDLGLRERVDIQVGRLAGAAWVRSARIGHRAIADVVWQILPGEQVIGVVGALIAFSVGVGTSVDNVEHRDTPFERPAGVREIVFETVFFEALDLKIIKAAQLWVSEERAIGFKALALVRDVERPVRRNLPEG